MKNIFNELQSVIRCRVNIYILHRESYKLNTLCSSVTRKREKIQLVTRAKCCSGNLLERNDVEFQ
jgi:hypothetical protein